MTHQIRVGIYARVSTDLQEKEHTVLSQLEALRTYAKEHCYSITDEYIDDGYSGATLERCGLDRLRDALQTDMLDTVLFHSPDRLARKAVYQGLVLEEIEKAGVRVEFLNYPVDDSPESRMLLGMQGLFAEYERAKIMERTRRGKLQRAKEGALVGGHAPFGYRWIKRSDAGRASLEKVEYQAAAIRRMYGLLVDEQLSTRAIAKRLTRDGVPTARGAAQWQPTAVFRMLTNPAYKGSYLYRQSGQEAISIAVPSLVDESTWHAAQDQLAQNSLFSRRNNKKQDYILRGLVRCPRCGGSYTGYVSRGFQRYRCNRTSWGSSSTGKRCTPGAVGAQRLDQAVWEAIKNALRNPQILEDEHKRQIALASSAERSELDCTETASALKRVIRQEDRITQAYINDAMDLERYKKEMHALNAQKEELEGIIVQRQRKNAQSQAEGANLEHIGTFCANVSEGLDRMTFSERQNLLRLLVERITVEGGQVKVDTIIPIGDDSVQLRTRPGEPVEPHTRGRTLRQAQVERFWSPYPFVVSLSNHILKCHLTDAGWQRHRGGSRGGLLGLCVFQPDVTVNQINAVLLVFFGDCALGGDRFSRRVHTPILATQAF